MYKHVTCQISEASVFCVQVFFGQTAQLHKWNLGQLYIFKEKKDSTQVEYSFVLYIIHLYVENFTLETCF